MPTCNVCGKDVMVTIENICLICNPPTEKQKDVITKVLVWMTEYIRFKRDTSKQETNKDV